MKNRGFLIICIVMGLVALNIVIAINENPDYEDYDEIAILNKGENSVEFNQTIFVRDLVYFNPLIESISYYDSYLNKNIAYVNVFGGIGKNFLIEPGKIYEINVQEEIILIIGE